MSDRCAYHEEHARSIQENTDRSKSNTLRLNEQGKLLNTIHEMNKNIEKLALNSEHTKEQVEKLVNVVSDHEKRLQSEETKEANEALKSRKDTVRQIKVGIIGSAVTIAIGAIGTIILILCNM